MPDLESILESFPLTVEPNLFAETALKHAQGKVALIGSARSGKTSLCKLFCGEDFPLSYQVTLGAQFSVRRFPQEGHVVHLHFLDLGGRPEYESLLRPLLSGVKTIAFVFDVTNRSSLEYLKQRVGDLETETGIVIGTRTDRKERRKISEEEGEAFAAGFGMQYVETSAKTASNVSESLKAIVRLVLEMQSGERSGASSAAGTRPSAPPRGRKSDERPEAPKPMPRARTGSVQVEQTVNAEEQDDGDEF